MAGRDARPFAFQRPKFHRDYSSRDPSSWPFLAMFARYAFTHEPDGTAAKGALTDPDNTAWSSLRRPVGA
jgi:hypothetical protein